MESERLLTELLRKRKQAGRAREVDVTERVFIALLVASGKTEDEARLQIKWVKGLGSRILIGSCLVGLAPEDNDGAAQPL